MHTTTLSGLNFPLVVSPDAAGESLVDTIGVNREALRTSLGSAGALLFRGFGVSDPADLASVVHALSGELLDYTERSSPRSSLSGNVFTSTEYPPNEEIFLHNECSYQLNWPGTVYFQCVTEPETLGATPLADVRDVLSRIHPDVVAEFRERGWMYVRNFGDMGGSWQYYYDTEDRQVVEKYCRASGIEVEWVGSDGLRTRAVRAALAEHPHSGAEVWFNHATFFHVRTLPALYRDELLDTYAPADLPSNTYYGDGSPIPDDVIDHLQQAYRSARIRFDWQRGDVLAIDNMLVAHGRESFTGPRRIAIGMADACTAPVQV
ncbi:TauD/TfdA family dioxygenase [Nocardia tengchongensis]|uniref:TauD/TfdA family dioxygenase n=1 Tax=Nocardia tengchongensis TaxID=2055889 RepID=UPI0036C1EBE9